jgi:hypothetical protein
LCVRASRGLTKAILNHYRDRAHSKSGGQCAEECREEGGRLAIQRRVRGLNLFCWSFSAGCGAQSLKEPNLGYVVCGYRRDS